MSFYADDINAVQQVDWAIYVLFARLCDNLGVARNMQVRRIPLPCQILRHNPPICTTDDRTNGDDNDVKQSVVACALDSRVVYIGET